jgi:hypothetical protein
LGELSPIGRFFGDWAIFWRLSEYLPIGRIFGDWAIFWRLSEYLPIGRIFGNWAITSFGQSSENCWRRQKF